MTKRKCYNLRITHGVSRGRDTYGYSIVTLYVDGVKEAQVKGGGFDMVGTTIGAWMTKHFQDKLRKLTANYGGTYDEMIDAKGFYGLVHWDTRTGKRIARVTKANSKYVRTVVDGMCGQSSVLAIARKIGIDYRFVR